MEDGDYLDMRTLKNKILIDTNVIIYMYTKKKDIFEFARRVIPNAEFYILDENIRELEKILKNKKTKLRKIKNYLNKLLENKVYSIVKVDKEIIKKTKTVDRLLIYFSNKYIIYTNDKILKNKIKNKKGKVLTLKEYGVYLN
jgi:rRNA-processing protein FCF1